MSVVKIRDSEVKQYVTCPKCKNHDFTVGHMLKENYSWSWMCDKCFTNFKFTYAKKQIHMEPIPNRSIPGLALVKYVGNNQNHQLYFFVEVYLQCKEDGSLSDEWEEYVRYYIEEHTCPTNLISCMGIVLNGGPDPHGVLQYVRAATYPDICARYGITVDQLLDSNNHYMHHYFHECGVEVLDDELDIVTHTNPQ